MPTTLSPNVTFVNVKEKFRNVMRCHRTLSKFAKYLTCGALTLWGRSRLQEGTNIYSWQLITCQNGLKRKRSPPMFAELFANFLKSLFARCGPSCKHKEVPTEVVRISVVPHGPIKFGDGSSVGFPLKKRFSGGTPCLSVVDFPDCEDSHARSIHMSFTSSASFWDHFGIPNG
ncbi:hypothetical protein Tco_1448481 [Tanacetum coccineum]